jgi:hypothetical protein
VPPASRLITTASATNSGDHSISCANARTPRTPRHSPPPSA